MVISSKRQMYELLRQGALGNTFQVWESLDDFACSGFRGLVGVRCSDVPGGPYWHHLTPQQGLYAGDIFASWGHTPVIYEASPDQHITMQGEFGWIDGRCWLRFSRAKTHMRAALEIDNNYADGRRAEILVRRHVGQEFWAETLYLEQVYPEAVVEFTAYDRSVGNKSQLAVCWERRHY